MDAGSDELAGLATNAPAGLPEIEAVLFGANEAYYRFCREERQLCALLAHLLMQRCDNARRFLVLVEERLKGLGQPPYLRLDEDLTSLQVYVEFAFLRDLWFQINAETPHSLLERNLRKRALIAGLFRRLPTLEPLVAAGFPASVPELNAMFMGAAGLKVTQHIASPARWSVAALYKLVGLEAGAATDAQRAQFRDLCKLKWSFNIKPDMVLVLPDHPPLCIEAKLESVQGSNPSNAKELDLFDQAFGDGKGRVGQIELQSFMFRVLLGCGSQSLFIGKSEQAVTIEVGNGETIAVPSLSWRKVFDSLDPEPSIPFVKQFIDENELIKKSEGDGPGADGESAWHFSLLGSAYFKQVFERSAANGVWPIVRLWTGKTGAGYGQQGVRPNWMTEDAAGKRLTNRSAPQFNTAKMLEWPPQEVARHFGLDLQSYGSEGA